MHLLQPLDVAFFLPLKTAWRSVLLQWRITSQGKKSISLSHNRFAGLLADTLTQEFKQYLENIRVSDFSVPPRNRKYQIPVLPGKSVSVEEVEAFYAKKEENASKAKIGKQSKQTPSHKQKNQPKKRKVTKKRKFLPSSDSDSAVNVTANKSNIASKYSIGEIEAEGWNTLEIDENILRYNE